jgi:hypothetical protein
MYVVGTGVACTFKLYENTVAVFYDTEIKISWNYMEIYPG